MPTPTAAQIRTVRPFAMEDIDLEGYATLAVTLDPFGIADSQAVTDDDQKTSLFSLLAAHLATILREPEAISIRFEGVTTQFNQGDALSKEALNSSGPGKLFLSTWTRLNRGWVLY